MNARKTMRNESYICRMIQYEKEDKRVGGIKVKYLKNDQRRIRKASYVINCHFLKHNSDYSHFSDHALIVITRQMFKREMHYLQNELVPRVPLRRREAAPKFNENDRRPICQ